MCHQSYFSVHHNPLCFLSSFEGTPEFHARVNAERRDVAEKVRQARGARKRAKGLLEAAKRAVEVAIESGEAAGLAVLAGADVPEAG